MSALSKRFFVALAAKYREKRPSDKYPDALQQWTIMVVATAMVLKEQAPSFDKARFLEACGVVVNTVGPTA